MLEILHIENVAVIESADIEFSAGLNVLTGETGAGKSIQNFHVILSEKAVILRLFPHRSLFLPKLATGCHKMILKRTRRPLFPERYLLTEGTRAE